MVLRTKKIIHFVGIGGIGMSGIAQVLLDMGYKVSGSDAEANNLTRRIEARGGIVYEGHRAGNLPADAGALVYSTSIAKDNPEMREAARRGIPAVHRAEVLAELFNRKKGIGVTGTHGKTTTTSMISVMLKYAGLDPTVIIGGEVSCFHGNASCGKGAYLVAEADESDSSFLRLRPWCAVITNMEAEHLDHYASLDEIKHAFRGYIGNVKPGGMVMYCYDDMNVRSVVAEHAGRSAGYGFSDDADIYPVDIEMTGFRTTYRCVRGEKTLGTIELNVPGRHNILNSLAAVLVGLELGIAFKDIAAALREFSGAKRRFQLRCEKESVMLIDDYAHHPTEIRAVLAACRNWKDKRIVAVFQPHRYTRTRFLADEFGTCFSQADKVILTDIYAASEPPIPGVSSRMLYDRMKANGMRDVSVVKKGDIADHIMRIKRSGDMILIMGAGDIKKVADELTGRLNGAEPVISDDVIAALRRTVKGKVKRSEELAGHTSFKIGGPAEVWVEPADHRDLRAVLAFCRARHLPHFVIGNGSNLLVGDSGYRGVVIKLAGSAFTKLSIRGTTVRVGAGFSLPRLIKVCCEKGLAGVESLAGIPGTIGGAVFMNAGGSTNPIYKNIGDVVKSVTVMDKKGRVKRITRADLAFQYRRSNLSPYVILEVTFALARSESRMLFESFLRFISIKKEKQALDLPSAGCVFKNPSDGQFTCGQMIDMLGLKGKRIGGAEISTRHANFIVNRGGATADDVLAMIGLVKERVRKNYALDLELEIKTL